MGSGVSYNTGFKTIIVYREKMNRIIRIQYKNKATEIHCLKFRNTDTS